MMRIDSRDVYRVIIESLRAQLKKLAVEVTDDVVSDISRNVAQALLLTGDEYDDSSELATHDEKENRELHRCLTLAADALHLIESTDEIGVTSARAVARYAINRMEKP